MNLKNAWENRENVGARHAVPVTSFLRRRIRTEREKLRRLK